MKQLLALSVVTLLVPQTNPATLIFSIKGQVRCTEGAITHVSISREAIVVTEFEFPTANPGNSRTVSLRPGSYSLITYVLPRQGARPPGPAQDRCNASFVLDDGARLYITRVQTDARSPDGREGGPCTVEVSTTRPAPE